MPAPAYLPPSKGANGQEKKVVSGAPKPSLQTTAVDGIPNGNQKQLTRRTRSRRAAEDPEVKKTLDALKAEWGFLRKDEKQERIEQLSQVMTYDAIAEAIGLSRTRIRQIMKDAPTRFASGPEEVRAKIPSQTAAPLQPRRLLTDMSKCTAVDKDEVKETGKWTDLVSRLEEILRDFFAGKYGAPRLTRAGIDRTLAQVVQLFHCQIYVRPPALELSPTASSEEIIRSTESFGKDPVAWLGSIRASLNPNPDQWDKAILRALNLR